MAPKRRAMYEALSFRVTSIVSSPVPVDISASADCPDPRSRNNPRHVIKTWFCSRQLWIFSLGGKCALPRCFRRMPNHLYVRQLGREEGGEGKVAAAVGSGIEAWLMTSSKMAAVMLLPIRSAWAQRNNLQLALQRVPHNACNSAISR
jgi:hypothetical protein